MEDFSKQKIVWKRVGSILRFCYDDSGCYALDSTCFATGSFIKFLILFLNSKMGNYMLQDSPKTGTGDLLISVQAIEPLKIPIPPKEDEENFNLLFDKVFIENDLDKITKFENEINNLIFNLYNFSENEKDVITKF
jgi:hypothetical protein